MDHVTLFLICIAGIFLIGSLGEIIFRRTSVPDVIWLILAGILLVPVFGVVSRAQLLIIAPYFSALTLVFVLFEGGSRLDVTQLPRSAARSALLAILTFLFASISVALLSALMVEMGWLPSSWTWAHDLLLGTIVGGSSSIIVMPAMEQAEVEPDLANLVSLESAFTDVLCVVGASSLMNILASGEAGYTSPGMVLLRSFGLGMLIGVVAGVLWLFLLRKLNRGEHAYPLTLSALLLLYVLVDRSGGSAALGILAFAVIVGNASHIGSLIRHPDHFRLELDNDVRGFHSQMVFIIKSFFFTFIGAMLAPPWGLVAMGIGLGLVLLLVRLPAAWLAMLRMPLDLNQKQLVMVSLPRGMAAGVLATLPAERGIAGMEGLPIVVFACVLMTILIFAIGFPVIRHRAVGPSSRPRLPDAGA